MPDLISDTIAPIAAIVIALTVSLYSGHALFVFSSSLQHAGQPRAKPTLASAAGLHAGPDRLYVCHPARRLRRDT